MAVVDSLTDGEITELSVDGLEPHPRNQEIYVNAEISDLVQEIQDHGFKEEHRLLVTPDKQILSGHRRWRAADKVGLERVPAEIVEVEDEQDALFRLLLANRYRHKTPAEQINEAEAWREYYKNDKTTNLSSGKEYDELVAEKVDIGVTTVKKGRKVKEIATGKRKAPREVVEVARQQWEAMKLGGEDGQSVHGAYKNIQVVEADAEVKSQKTVSIKKKPVVTETDAIDFLTDFESVDLVITDPPYQTDLEDVGEFVGEWIPELESVLGSDGLAFIFIGGYANEIQAYLNELSNCGLLSRASLRIWNFNNTTGKAPKYKYRQNWQAIIFIQSEPATELSAPRTSELSGVQEFNQPHEFGDAEASHYKWQKPRKLLNQMIRHTTDAGDLVVDPFVGSGSTVLEAASLGRQAVGCDIDADVLEIATQRGCVWEERWPPA